MPKQSEPQKVFTVVSVDTGQVVGVYASYDMAFEGKRQLEQSVATGKFVLVETDLSEVDPGPEAPSEVPPSDPDESPGYQ